MREKFLCKETEYKKARTRLNVLLKGAQTNTGLDLRYPKISLINFLFLYLRAVSVIFDALQVLDFYKKINVQFI